MPYYFRNLVFEGGGVKGIAYLGAMQLLEEKGIIANIKRIGGTSVGAINATLVALGFTNEEMRNIIWNMDFKNFMDDTWGLLPDIERLINKFGWYKGDFFHEWISGHIKKKLGDPNATFEHLREAKRPDLFVYGTNLSTHFGEVFSIEHTPKTRIADAVRISMSIPLFFAAVRNARNDVYVDGGVLNSYPIKLFDRNKYIIPENASNMWIQTKYYDEENGRFLKKHPKSSPYVYNKQTLGFRLSSEQDIAVFRYGAEPQHVKIDSLFDYSKALITTVLEFQQDLHLHSDDWQRSIYIDTLGVGATDFGLPDETKRKLVESGRKGAEVYFKWFDDQANSPVNRI